MHTALSRLPRYLLVLMALAVLVRLLSFAWVATHGGEAVLVSGDATTYVEVAHNIAAGHGFTVEQGGVFVPEVFRAPGMSLLLAPFMLLPGGIFWWGAFLSIVAGILLPLCTYLLAARLFDRRAALIAATLAAFEPHLIWFSWLLLSEMSAALLLLSAATLASGSWPARWWLRGIFIGALLGLLVLVRPPFFPILIGVLCIAAIWAFVKHEKRTLSFVIVVALVLFVSTVPWSLRNQSVTGQYALSGMGWYNLYFDYLSSLNAVDKGTPFADEKINRLTHLPEGIEAGEESSPSALVILRREALNELWERRGEVAKLEPAFALTYFTHDGYFKYGQQLGVIRTPEGPRGPSPTFILLSQGVSGVPAVLAELERQYFIPLLGRAFTLAVALLALASAWLYRRKPEVVLLALLIVLAAGVGTVAGLTLEARSRVPVEPLLFVLAAGAVSALVSKYRPFFRAKGPVL